MLFKEVAGQEKIKKKLIQSVEKNRISHAQLFLGKDGFGGLPLAIAYAQYIACKNKTGTDSCGTCPSCIKYNKLIHPDLHFIFPVNTTPGVKEKPVSSFFMKEWRETVIQQPYLSIEQWQKTLQLENKQLNISVHEGREIIKKLSLKPYESEYKIMLIWHAEKLNIQAGNALLKILEEPPDKTLFILLSDSTESFMPTILSRLQIIKLEPVDNESISNYLHEYKGVEKEIALKMSVYADGDVIEALQLVEDENFNLSYFNYFTAFFRLCYKANVPELIKWSEEISKLGREQQKRFLLYVLRLLRSSLLTNAGCHSIIRLLDYESDFIKNFAPFIHAHNILPFINLFDEAFYYLERNGNSKLIFLDCALKTVKLIRVKATA